jgi:hypothetical protein
MDGMASLALNHVTAQYCTVPTGGRLIKRSLLADKAVSASSCLHSIPPTQQSPVGVPRGRYPIQWFHTSSFPIIPGVARQTISSSLPRFTHRPSVQGAMAAAAAACICLQLSLPSNHSSSACPPAYRKRVALAPGRGNRLLCTASGASSSVVVTKEQEEGSPEPEIFSYKDDPNFR